MSASAGGGEAGLGYRHPDRFDWPALHAQWQEDGCAIERDVVDRTLGQHLRGLYPDDGRFRSRVVMEQHGFGLGDYAYFASPLPPPVAELRRALYPHLAGWANEMALALGRPADYPRAHEAFLARCAALGQTKPTPLLLHYTAGGFNCLHRDLYGEIVFPLQAMVLLSEPGADFDGGEFVLVENRPRQQSRATALSPRRGDLVIFPVSERPVMGRRRMLRASVRHGVSRLRSGERFTLGIIFHDAA